MLNFIKKLFHKNDKKFSDEEYELHYEVKKEALEKVLGPMHDLVGHAIIPFQVGGAVDMYYFPQALPGTGFATMELIEPDGSGPRPNRAGTYELLAFTQHNFTPVDTESDQSSPFNLIERHICGIFTSIGNYSYHATLKPLDTCEIPGDEGQENNCLIFDEFRKDGIEFRINGKKHCLLLCIEIFRSEMEYARKNGGQTLLTKLKNNGFYPYSDLDRKPVV